MHGLIQSTLVIFPATRILGCFWVPARNVAIQTFSHWPFRELNFVKWKKKQFLETIRCMLRNASIQHSSTTLKKLKKCKQFPPQIIRMFPPKNGTFLVFQSYCKCTTVMVVGSNTPSLPFVDRFCIIDFFLDATEAVIHQ